MSQITVKQINEFIRSASLEDARLLNEHLNIRFRTLESERRQSLRIGDIVYFETSKRHYYGIDLIGKVMEIRTSRARVSCPSYGIWNVPVTQLKTATDVQRAKYDERLRSSGEPVPRLRRKSKDRQLLESLLGIAR